MKKTINLLFVIISIYFITSIILINCFNNEFLNTYNKKSIKELNNNKNCWAVVIGVSDYPGVINDLYFCHKDALEIKEWLINQNFSENNIICLLNKDATKQNILNALNWVANKSDENDYFVFYYSGHGILANSQAAIVPYDFNSEGFLNGSILMNFFNKINYSRLIAFFDSCNSGGLINFLKGKNRIIMTACSESEDCLEDTLILKHGIFTAFLLKAYENLNADYNHDRKVTIEEAFNYTYKNSLNFSLIYYNYIQHAQMFDNITGDFFLSPYVDVKYQNINFGYVNLPIEVEFIGFDTIINVSIYLNSNRYSQVLNFNFVNQSLKFTLKLLVGSYTFRFIVHYLNKTYISRYYKLNILSFFQSNLGLLFLILSICSTAALSALIYIFYKKYTLIKLELFEE